MKQLFIFSSITILSLLFTSCIANEIKNSKVFVETYKSIDMIPYSNIVRIAPVNSDVYSQHIRLVRYIESKN